MLQVFARPLSKGSLLAAAAIAAMAFSPVTYAQVAQRPPLSSGADGCAMGSATYDIIMPDDAAVRMLCPDTASALASYIRTGSVGAIRRDRATHLPGYDESRAFYDTAPLGGGAMVTPCIGGYRYLERDVRPGRDPLQNSVPVRC